MNRKTLSCLVVLIVVFFATSCGSGKTAVNSVTNLVSVSSQTASQTVATATQTETTATTAAVPTPPPPTPSVSVQITSIISPIAAGANNTLSAKTSPSASCSIVVTYKSGPSTAQGLTPKTADGSGNVSWSWMVGTRTTPGSWPATVTCSSGGQTAIATASFIVQ